MLWEAGGRGGGGGFDLPCPPESHSEVGVRRDGCGVRLIKGKYASAYSAFLFICACDVVRW